MSFCVLFITSAIGLNLYNAADADIIRTCQTGSSGKSQTRATDKTVYQWYSTIERVTRRVIAA